MVGPEWNGTERKHTGGMQVIERQMAKLAFRFNGTEWNGNVNIFMPPTVGQWMDYLHLQQWAELTFYRDSACKKCPKIH